MNDLNTPGVLIAFANSALRGRREKKHMATKRARLFATQCLTTLSLLFIDSEGYSFYQWDTERKWFVDENACVLRNLLGFRFYKPRCVRTT